MKYVLFGVLLLSNTYSLSLFKCICVGKNMHHKIKEQTDETFLTENINKPQPIILHLQNSNSPAERFISRAIPHHLFKKTAEWSFQIVQDQNNCLDLVDTIITCPGDRQKDSLHLYTWELQPKNQGIALVRTTFTAPYRKNNPHIQEFWVTVE